jgi:hypothetical protein
MDFQHVVTNDQELLTELFDREGELKAAAPGDGALESLEGGATAFGLDRMREGTTRAPRPSSCGSPDRCSSSRTHW